MLLPARQQFSHSRLTLLERCPRQYRFRYVEKVREAFRSVEAFCGTLVHEALGWLYTEREHGRSPEAGALVDRFRDLWRERVGSPAQPVRVIRDERTLESYLDDGVAILRTHHAGAFERDRRETLGVEERIRLGVDGHAYVGFVDRLCRDADGTLHVVDFKTARQVPAEDGPDAVDGSLQVRGYGAAVLERHGGERVVLELDYVRHDRQVKESLDRAALPEVARSIGRRIATTVAAEAAGDFPARPSALCAWCGFREACDASPFHAGPAAAAVGADPGRCPDCERPLSLRHGRRGAFVGCTGYPDCRYARNAAPRELPPTQGDGETTCPLCGAELRRRDGRRGAFLGCSAYPRCRFTRDAPEVAP